MKMKFMQASTAVFDAFELQSGPVKNGERFKRPVTEI
jgi:hypothetical protein